MTRSRSREARMARPAGRGSGPLASIDPVARLVAVVPAVAATVLVREAAVIATLAIGAAVLVIAGARPRIVAVGAAAVVLAVLGGWVTLSVAAFSTADRGEALTIGLAAGARTVALPLLALAAALGPTADGLVSSLVGVARIPYRYAFAPVVAARLVAGYRDDLATIRLARRARGATDGMGPIRRLLSATAVILPLLVGGVRRAERLAIVMDARGFGMHPTRTDRHPAVLRRRDVVFVAAAWTATIGLALIGATVGSLLARTGS